MALVVEDGTGVTDANSYVDLDYLEDYALLRGLTLPATDADKEILVIKAMDYIEALKFQGLKTDPDQALQWPREGVWLDDVLIDNDDIPVRLQNALCQLVVEQQAGTPLYPAPRTSTSEGFVTEKTVGPLTKKFSSFGATSSTSPIRIAAVHAFLQPLLGCCSNVLKTVRT